MKKTQTTKESIPILADLLIQLQDLMPQVFAEGKIDFEKLRASLGDLVDELPERYSFSWAGKRDAIRLLQVPSRATLIPARDESLDFDTTQNLFIEGDNLEVLKLLYKPYFGRVKMIYIDPPYNTGNDFVYPDNFADPLDTYLKLTGQKDSEGNLLTSNPETGGRYHSAWLSMMYPRLFLARQLLREDGVIFVSIDNHEVHNLHLLMNEIFGEECFLGLLIWKSRQYPDARSTTQISIDHEYILAYAKSSDSIFRGIERDESKFDNPDNDPRGRWMSRSILGLATREQRPNLHFTISDPRTGYVFTPPENTGWRYSQERMLKLIDENRIIFPASPKGRPREKKFRDELLNEFIPFPSIIDDIFTANGTSEIREIFGYDAINFPKPSGLIQKLVKQTTSEDDLVLDFFSGSCTTAQAVLELNREDGGNRRFILVQLPEPTGNKQFPTIAEIGKERIRRVVARMKKERNGQLALDKPEDLGFKVFKLAPSNYKQWVGADLVSAQAQPDAESYARQAELFADPLVEGWQLENVLYEVALKEGYGLTIQIEETAVKGVQRITDPDKGQSFYLALAGKIALKDLRPLDLKKDELFICRDSALDDETAANLALQCRLKTI